MSAKPLAAYARPWLRRTPQPAPRLLGAVVFMLLLVTCLRRGRPVSQIGGSEDEKAMRESFLEAAGRHRSVVLIVTSGSHAALAHNLVCHLRRLNVDNYLVVSLDARAFATLRKRHVRVHPAPWRLQTNDNASFGTASFVGISLVKTRIVLAALTSGVDTLLVDTDVAWLRDARRIMSRPRGDIIATSDARPGEPLNTVLNSGLYFARTSASTIATFRRIARYALAIRRSEQKAFNHVLCGAFRRRIAGPGRRVGNTRCELPQNRGPTVSVKVLPLHRFPNGATATWNRTLSRIISDGTVVAMHANYLSGANAKEQRLRAMGLWLVSDDGSNCLPFNI